LCLLIKRNSSQFQKYLYHSDTSSSPPRRDAAGATFIHPRVVISYRDIGTPARHPRVVTRPLRAVSTARQSRAVEYAQERKREKIADEKKVSKEDLSRMFAG